MRYFKEVEYQRELVKKIKEMFPDCMIIRNDPGRTQGMPDVLILFKNMWAMLEVKLSEKAPVRPNQQYYVEKFNGMSFASFINPENEEEVLNDLQRAFGSVRKARLSKSK